ncbi:MULTISPECIES: hypothetical protein [unclassified Corallococcus]|uniref:hypothetical protein n=1 Tax=unclassified Corallococcus TaxID=2685029 RepID=UPI001A8C3312|nr:MULTISPECIES: hypothetical protein [unclassified Corallococcus]MBN9685165.1 hypothetical protein [Corallococcus sp. NCSPR001]WAS83377.1 hypothetical protein O0N60_29190 [Corallococcus sp. NCRR]
MYRSILALAACGLLLGCGGQPEDDESLQVPEESDTQSGSSGDAERPVEAFSTNYAATSGALAWFTDFDNLYIRDTSADGLGAAAVLWVGNIQYVVWATNGQGSENVRNLDFPPNQLGYLYACVGRKPNFYNCNYDNPTQLYTR